MPFYSTPAITQLSDVTAKTGTGTTVAMAAAPSLGGQVLITPASSSTKGLVIKGAASQSDRLLDIRNSSDASFFFVDQDGNLVLTSGNFYISDSLGFLWGTSNIIGRSSSYITIQVAGTEVLRVDTSQNIGIGTAVPATRAHVAENPTISGTVTDGYSAAVTLNPSYTASGGAQTVTRHNYIDVRNTMLFSSAAVTDACLVRFDAAAGTHKAVDAGTTKTTPITVNAWLKCNLNGAIVYIPMYTSKTS